MSAKPAILGGEPIFANKVPIVRPLLPSFDVMADAIYAILKSGMLTTGQHLHAFEAAVADHLGVKHAVAVSSCTTGLMLTYRGLGLTDEVVVPSFTFMATVSAMLWANLRPVFADVNADTTNLDPAAAEAVITPATSAIVATHNFGTPADIQALQWVADRHGLKLVFDAAHGFGSLYQGKPVGSQGDAQVFSLSPTKLLIAGEGGIVATNDDQLANYIRMGRDYGKQGNYDSIFPGFNARMSEFHALLGLRSLDMLEQAVRRRNEAVAIYQDQLGQVPGIGFQQVRSVDRSSYKDFSIIVHPEIFGLHRDHLAVALAAENIDTRKYYDPPVHRQTAYSQFAPSAESLSKTNQLSACSLSLPIWSHMDDSTIRDICRALQRIHVWATEVRKALLR